MKLGFSQTMARSMKFKLLWQLRSTLLQPGACIRPLLHLHGARTLQMGGKSISCAGQLLSQLWCRASDRITKT
jgi:hypothetical protein